MPIQIDLNNLNGRVYYCVSVYSYSIVIIFNNKQWPTWHLLRGSSRGGAKGAIAPGGRGCQIFKGGKKSR